MSEIRTDCPSKSFEVGESNGKCYGDGHYLCNNCKHFVKEFVNNEELRNACNNPHFIRLLGLDYYLSH